MRSMVGMDKVDIKRGDKKMFGNNCGPYGCGGETLYNAMNIPNYGEDHNTAENRWHGEDPYTSQYNIPALLAARTSGGVPHPRDISNGINNINDFDTLANRCCIPSYGCSSYGQGEGIYGIPAYHEAAYYRRY